MFYCILTEFSTLMFDPFSTTESLNRARKIRLFLNLFILWLYVEEIEAEVEEVERSPGGDEDNADPNQELVCLPPSLLLPAQSGGTVGKS